MAARRKKAVRIGKGMKESAKKVASARRNGTKGGAPKGSFPINTLARAKSALKLAHNAPNPQGIKNAVYKKYPQLKKGGR